MGFRTIEVGALQIKSEEGNLSALDKIQEELWRKTDASQCRARQRVGPDLVTKQTKRVSICKYVLLKGLLNSKMNMMRKHGERIYPFMSYFSCKCCCHLPPILLCFA